jgi:hypothetical protein
MKEIVSETNRLLFLSAMITTFGTKIHIEENYGAASSASGT